MKTTFYLVRHGQPDWDWAEAMRFYGPCSAYMPLTPLGVEQIEHTACDSQLRGASFILASPYTRTMQSAQILSRRLDLPVTVEWELHEWLYDCDMRGDLPTPGERFGREDMTRCFYRYMEHDELTGEDNCETYAVIAERVLGCLCGALFLGVINNALPVIGISPFWQMAISGAVIVMAVLLNERGNRGHGRLILRNAALARQKQAVKS